MRHSLALLPLLLAVPAAAESPSPYAGLADRTIRALSVEQQADLLAGRGMGLALAAERNGWPGPLHVLELADRLALTPDQRDATEALLATMRVEAQALGARLVAEEEALDEAFRTRRIDEADLARRMARIGTLQGEVRLVHLRTHLAQAAVLTAEQISAYGRLRGYTPGATPASERHDGHR